MSQLLMWAGRLAGCLGVFVCAVALVARLTGTWVVADVSIATLLQLGMAAMIFACLAYCAVLAELRGR
jgi:hypothetical protein